MDTNADTNLSHPPHSYLREQCAHFSSSNPNTNWGFSQTLWAAVLVVFCPRLTVRVQSAHTVFRVVCYDIAFRIIFAVLFTIIKTTHSWLCFIKVVATSTYFVWARGHSFYTSGRKLISPHKQEHSPSKRGADIPLCRGSHHSPHSPSKRGADRPLSESVPNKNGLIWCRVLLLF